MQMRLLFSIEMYGQVNINAIEFNYRVPENSVSTVSCKAEYFY